MSSWRDRPETLNSLSFCGVPFHFSFLTSSAGLPRWMIQNIYINRSRIITLAGRGTGKMFPVVLETWQWHQWHVHQEAKEFVQIFWANDRTSVPFTQFFVFAACLLVSGDMSFPVGLWNIRCCAYRAWRYEVVKHILILVFRLICEYTWVVSLGVQSPRWHELMW